MLHADIKKFIIKSMKEELDKIMKYAYLNPRELRVLILRDIEHRTYADIGVILGVTKSRIQQIVDKVREKIKCRTEYRDPFENMIFTKGIDFTREAFKTLKNTGN